MLHNRFGGGKNRDSYIDNVAGVMILTMLVLHITVQAGVYRPYGYWLIHATYFFMAWFFFKAGMYHKKGKGILHILRNGFNRLLLPFFIFVVVGFIIRSLLAKPVGFHLSFLGIYLIQNESLPGSEALWFLPSLLACRLFFELIPSYRIVRSIVFSLTIMTHYALLTYTNALPIWIYNIPLGFAFYLMGSLISDKQYDNEAFLLAIIIYAILFGTHIGIDIRTGEINPYISSFVYCVVGCIMFNNLFKRYTKLCNPILHWIGTNSMSIYVFHWPLLMIFASFTSEMRAFTQVIFYTSGFAIMMILSLILRVCIKRKQIVWKRTNQKYL